MYASAEKRVCTCRSPKKGCRSGAAAAHGSRVSVRCQGGVAAARWSARRTSRASPSHRTDGSVTRTRRACRGNRRMVRIDVVRLPVALAVLLVAGSLAAGAVPRLPERCHAVTAATTAVDGTGLTSRWRVECGSASLTGERIGVDRLTALPSGAVVRVVFADGRVAEGILSRDHPDFVVPAEPRPWDVFAAYVRLGVGHILTGPDHLLFVFGLVLLAGATRRLLATVTAFTLGHSITLTLAALGLVRLPPAPIEVAIAASVFVLAVELARDAGRPSAIRRR